MTRLLHLDNAAATAIDFQEKLVPAMTARDDLLTAASKLTAGLRVKKVPLLVTQLYTKGLGETVPAMREALGSFTPIEKNTFSALKTEAYVNALQETGARQIILFGIETHICVEQTALQLLDDGYEVFVAADCCSSRKASDRDIALQRMAQAGAVVATGEASLFELIDSSRSEGFKEISRIIK